MPVLDQRYRRWQGAPTSYFRRMLVIPAYDAMEILSRRKWTAIYVMALLPPLVLGAYVYIAANSEVLSRLLPFLQGRQLALPLPGPATWASVTRIQLTFIAAFGLLVGPPLLTRDFANNALPLYLSKSLRRSEYVLGRWAILIGLFSLASWIPLTLVFVLELVLAPAAWRSQHFWLAGRMFAATVPWILVLTALSSAIAAHLHRANLARAALLGVILVTWPMGRVLEEQTGSPAARVVSPLAMAVRINQWAFEPPATHAAAPSTPEWSGPSRGRDVPVPVAFAVLGGWVAACVLVLARRVRAVEVVG